MFFFFILLLVQKNEARKARGFGDLAKIGAARPKAAELAPSGLRHRCFLTPLRHRFFNANPLKAESCRLGFDAWYLSIVTDPRMRFVYSGATERKPLRGFIPHVNHLPQNTLCLFWGY